MGPSGVSMESPRCLLRPSNLETLKLQTLPTLWWAAPNTCAHLLAFQLLLSAGCPAIFLHRYIKVSQQLEGTVCVRFGGSFLWCFHFLDFLSESSPTQGALNSALTHLKSLRLQFCLNSTCQHLLGWGVHLREKLQVMT